MSRTVPVTSAENRVSRIVRIATGVVFLWSSGVHVGIVAADSELYRDVADAAWLPGIRTAWADVFMAHPELWGLMIALGELAIGTALLTGGRWARYGLVGAGGFHVGLMTLGWGYWLWSLPVLAILLGPGRRRHPALMTDNQELGARVLSSAGPGRP